MATVGKTANRFESCPLAVGDTEGSRSNQIKVYIVPECDQDFVPQVPKSLNSVTEK